MRRVLTEHYTTSTRPGDNIYPQTKREVDWDDSSINFAQRRLFASKRHRPYWMARNFRVPTSRWLGESTEKDMRPDVFWIHAPLVGRLAIMPRPRAGEWL